MIQPLRPMVEGTSSLPDLPEGFSSSVKLGQSIAGRIEHDILSGVMAVGQRLGSELDLSQQFGVSRWIIREAIAIIEMDGLVESRRGQRGGIYVASPAMEMHASILRHYFSLSGASPEQINGARLLVEGHMATIAMRNLTIDDAARLRRFAQLPYGAAVDQVHLNTHEILREMVRVAKQPVMELFAFALAQSNIDLALWNGASPERISALSYQTWEKRVAQLEAIIAYDAKGVALAQQDISALGLDFHNPLHSPPADIFSAIERTAALVRDYNIGDVEKTAKKPEALARLIARRISEQGLSPGDRIGSEADISEMFGIGRGVLREAARMLERYGVVGVQRGVQGGLHVIEPDPALVVRAVSRYFMPRFSDDPEALFELTKLIFLEAASQAAERALSDRPAVLAIADAQRGRAVGTDRKAGFAFIAAASGNTVLHCLMQILALAMVDHDDPEIASAADAIAALCLQLEDAVLEGDGGWARRVTLEMLGLCFSAKLSVTSGCLA